MVQLVGEPGESSEADSDHDVGEQAEGGGQVGELGEYADAHCGVAVAIYTT
jgi:hypothetical protein